MMSENYFPSFNRSALPRGGESTLYEIEKAIFIIDTVFSEDTASRLEEVENHEDQFRGFELPNQGKESELIYKLHVEELLAQGNLGEFIARICEDHQSNQILQDTKEDLINLLENLDAEKGEINLEPPSVSVKHATERVYDAPQQDRTSSSDRGTPSRSDGTEPQFTFNRFIEDLKQFFCTLTDETERSGFTPKQFIGYIVMFIGAILMAIGLGVDKKN